VAPSAALVSVGGMGLSLSFESGGEGFFALGSWGWLRGMMNEVEKQVHLQKTGAAGWG
jgi:hypothetical protein